MTASRLSIETQRKLEHVVDELAAQARTPSLRAWLFDEGELVWSRDVGDVAGQYRIGSITKTFTAVMVMRLRDEGLIDLNRAIGAYLDDTPYAEATIRDLLSHRAGITAEPVGSWWERTAGADWSLFAARNSAEVRVCDPGVRYHYSNLGYGLLGQLVARVRGQQWYDALRDELLTPLDLGETTYHPRTDAAIGTSRNPITGELQQEPAHDTAAMAAAGQLWSSPRDLVRWAQVLAGAEHGVISSESIRELQTAHAADVNDQHQGAYGLGLRLRWQAAGTLVGHTGSMPGFLAGLFVDPASGVGGLALANCTTGMVTERLIVRLLDVASELRAANKSTAKQNQEPIGFVSELEGTWYWGNTALQLAAAGAGFELGSKARGPAHFRPAGSDRFVGIDDYWNGETLSVVRGSDGEVSHLEVVTFILTRSPYDPQAPIPGGPPLPMP